MRHASGWEVDPLSKEPYAPALGSVAESHAPMLQGVPFGLRPTRRRWNK